MNEILVKYLQLRADLDKPMTVRADVVQAFREVYDAATKVAGSDMAELRRMLENEKPPATDNGLLSDEG